MCPKITIIIKISYFLSQNSKKRKGYLTYVVDSNPATHASQPKKRGTVSPTPQLCLINFINQCVNPTISTTPRNAMRMGPINVTHDRSSKKSDPRFPLFSIFILI